MGFLDIFKIKPKKRVVYRTLRIFTVDIVLHDDYFRERFVETEGKDVEVEANNFFNKIVKLHDSNRPIQYKSQNFKIDKDDWLHPDTNEQVYIPAASVKFIRITESTYVKI